ncbi:polysaccharide pyruvyl transferase family protein [Sabulicella glaciei]|uniref:Polysaccharide pyruvyl transferase family protein n=1 Tax=Sabulicella glaciei TaxID=2984948 RepID=A0ABT3NSF6_9PROT|nr:polysaccharide pyruvyl transferase family protein [Roseococcus sp. MDT2-1-1]MCW8085102.1 polysaccharide pyruvyl transferase family protein [Roseococcus sp. MDT2-1-1]
MCADVMEKTEQSSKDESKTLPKMPRSVPRVALLWKTLNLGLYSNSEFGELYKAVGHNTGNLAFVYAIASQITNPVQLFPWHVSAAKLKESADIVVIPCANQLGRHTELGDFADRLSDAGLPVVAIGLGAQAEDYTKDVVTSPGTLRWAQVIARLSVSSLPNIYTRGAYTTSQLDKLGVQGSLPGGCPSYFTNQDVKLGQKIYENWTKNPLPRSITVAGGHESWVKTREIEHQLIGMMMDPLVPGQYVVQSMGDMIKISRGEFDSIEEKTLTNIRLHTVPHYSLEEFKVWCRTYARSFYDVPSWMDTLRRHDLTIGSRYHGVALALQAERMGLTITIDSRTRELCENTSVPHISSSELTAPITRSSLKKVIRFDPSTYDAHRATAAKHYVQFLENNMLKPAPYLQKIAESS